MACIKFSLISLAAALLLPSVLVSGQQSQPAQPPAPRSVSNQSAVLEGASGGEKIITEYAPPPENYRRSVEYSSARYHHYFVNALYGFLILLFILQWRLGPKYRDWAERISSRGLVQVIVYAPALLLTASILDLPADIWDQSLDRSFGLSVEHWGSWLMDWVTNQMVLLVVGTILVWILYAVIRRSRRRWWLYFWMASIPVLLAVFFLQPLVIDPLFFKFTPLQISHAELVARMEQVVHHGGMDIPPGRIYEMNASSKVSSVNAYVAGFGASKRAVVWDTTISTATVPEILFVFGHEMGHYVLLHIPKEISIDAAILLLLIYLGFRTANWMLARWGQRWGIRGIEDRASLPLLIFIISMLAFFATPAFNAVSRYFEHEADRYGLEVMHGIVPDQGQVAARAFEKSGEINLADPHPNLFIKIWMFDHPTRPERVQFAATYDPWSQGEAPRYVH
jgi:STE24 endopeptidase